MCSLMRTVGRWWVGAPPRSGDTTAPEPNRYNRCRVNHALTWVRQRTFETTTSVYNRCRVHAVCRGADVVLVPIPTSISLQCTQNNGGDWG
ncbi:MAG: hypothetical protein JWM95_3674 [Gemmatimonadetes bacterium]|nr:hypothetical protein [Gemmatimonadota bacterium]